MTRIEHPTNGNFDVVIMQSATRDDLPDVGGMLTGTPVYSVYLHVGDHKEWLMEYCVPVTQAAQTSSYEINVEDATPLTPPYPISTAIPKDLAAREVSPPDRPARCPDFCRYSEKHQSARRQQRAGQPDSGASERVAVPPRPRNKTAIDVEILLVIPPRV